MLKIIVALLSFIFIIFGLSPSDDVGTTAFSYLLKNDTGARGSALGGAYVGWGKSQDGFSYNPAAVGFLKYRGVSVEYENLWGMFNAGYAAYHQSLGRNDYTAVALKTISYGGDFVRTDGEGYENGTFSVGDFSVEMTYSRKLSKVVSIGGAMKFLYSFADTFSASALCGDVGAMFSFERDKLRAGIVVTNIGSMIGGYTDEKYPLPLTVKAGTSYDLPGFPGVFGTQVETGTDIDFKARAGMELDFIKNFALRFGYILQPKAEEDPSDSETLNGITADAGIYYKKFSLDYAMQNYGLLGMAHKVSIAYRGF